MEGKKDRTDEGGKNKDPQIMNIGVRWGDIRRKKKN